MKVYRIIQTKIIYYKENNIFKDGLWKITCYIFLGKFQVYMDTLELKLFRTSKLRSHKSF